MQLEALVLGQPGLDYGVAMGTVVVQDEVQVEVGRELVVELPQEREEFLVPMAAVDLIYDVPLKQFQSGEQRGGPVTLV